MDNLEDVVAGGRVTRSLRKRLASVDSDASSRPGTPVVPKLTAIIETSENAAITPGKRTTRRNSITTPVKTPAKSRLLCAETPEISISSPARRSTRKRSISITEEESTRSIVAAIKGHSKFETLPEEDLLHPQINERTTRSKSKSPMLIQQSPNKTYISPNKSGGRPRSARKPGPKSKTLKYIENYDSDVEIINLVDEDTETSDANEFERKSKVNDEQPIQAKSVEEVHTEVIDLLDEKKVACEKEQPTNEISVNVKEIDNSAKRDKSNKNVFIEEVIQLDTLTPTAIARYIENKTQKESITRKKIVDLSKVGFVGINEDAAHKIVYPKTPVLKKNKNNIDIDVDADTSTEEFSHKSLENEAGYKGIEIPEIQAPEELIEHLKDSSKESGEYHDASNVNDINNIYDEPLITQTNSPFASKLLKNMQSSTPIVTKATSAQPKVQNITLKSEHTTSPKINTSLEKPASSPILITPEKSLRSGKTYGETPSPTKSPQSKIEKLETSVKESKQSTVENTTVDEKNKSDNSAGKKVSLNNSGYANSWIQGVSGKAQANGKIDAIVADQRICLTEEANMNISKQETPIKGTPTKRHSHYQSEDDKNFKGETAAAIENEVDEEFVELTDNEQPYKQHSFVDDEAMEVDADYRSGASLDEDERGEIKTNEVPIDGESLGSEDTEDGQNNTDDDCENDSFITSDSEADNILLEYSEDDEHLEEQEYEPIQSKSYKRIQLASSDDSEHEPEKAVTEQNATNKNSTRGIKTEDENKDISLRLALEVTALTDEEFNEETIIEQCNIYNANEERKSINKSRRSDANLKQEAHQTKVADLNRSKEAKQKSFKIENGSPENQKEKRKSLQKSAIDQVEKYEEPSMHITKRKKSLPMIVIGDGVQKVPVENLNSSKLSESAACKLKNATDNMSELYEQEEHVVQQLNDSRKKSLDQLNKMERFNRTLHEIDINQTETSNDTTKEHRLMESKQQSLEDCAFSTHMSAKARRSIHETVNNSVVTNNLKQEVIATSSSNESDSNLEKSASKTETGSARTRRTPLCQSRLLQKPEIYESSSNEEYYGNRNDTVMEKKHAGNRENNIDSNDNEWKEIQVEKSNQSFNSSIHIAESSDGESETNENERSTVYSTNENESDDKCAFDVSKSDNKKLDAFGLSVQLDQSRSEISDDKTKLYSFASERTENVSKIGTESNSDMENETYAEQQEPKKSGMNKNEGSGEENINNFDNCEESQYNDENKNDIIDVKNENAKAHMSNVRRQSLIFTKTALNSSMNKKTTTSSLQNTENVNAMQLSQSFVANIEERKCNIAKGNAKRKRLSKSICIGSLDTTNEHEVAHLHKKKKMGPDESFFETVVDTKHSVLSSTPSQTTLTNKCLDIKQILGRCDEILEAANCAKLQAKINNKKNKVKPTKKIKAKHAQRQESQLVESAVKLVKSDDSKEIGRKAAVKQALKAAANIILKVPEKKKQTISTDGESKRIPLQVLTAISETEAQIIKKKKLTQQNDKLNEKQVHAMKSTAGVVIETPMTPQKKKNKLHVVELAHPTGTVRIEPITPIKRKTKTNNGFRESPITPLTTGFKVRQILTTGQDTPPELPILRGNTKRKRHTNELKRTLLKPVWTQTGPFFEEQLLAPTKTTLVDAGSSEFLVARLNCPTLKIRKNRSNQAVNSASTKAYNFKNKNLQRADIPREESHDVLQRKQRHYVHNQF